VNRYLVTMSDQVMMIRVTISVELARGQLQRILRDLMV
jgi:hypothetical protein